MTAAAGERFEVPLKLLKASAGVAVARIVGMGLGFVMTIVLARHIGAAGLGIYGYATLLLTLLGVFVSNGSATMLLRETSRSLVNPAWHDVRGMMRWGVGIALGVALLATVAGALLQHNAGGWGLPFVIIPILGLVLFFDQLSALRLAVLRGINQPVWGQLPETLFRPLLIIAVFLILAGLSAGPVTLIEAFIALAIASVTSLLIGTLILRSKAPIAFSQAEPVIQGRAWAKTSSILAGSAALVMLNGQMDVLLLGVLGTSEDLGLYRIATQIALLSAFGYTTINFIMMQKFAYLVEKNDRIKLHKISKNSARICFISTLILPLVFYIYGDTIISFVFGGFFVSAIPSLMWLLAAQVVNAFFGFSRSLLVMGGMERKVLPLTAVGVVMNGALCLLLVPIMGLKGAAFANFIATGLWNGVIWFQCYKIIGIDTSVIGLPLRMYPSTQEESR